MEIAAQWEWSMIPRKEDIPFCKLRELYFQIPFASNYIAYIILQGLQMSLLFKNSKWNTVLFSNVIIHRLERTLCEVQ